MVSRATRTELSTSYGRPAGAAPTARKRTSRTTSQSGWSAAARRSPLQAAWKRTFPGSAMCQTCAFALSGEARCGRSATSATALLELGAREGRTSHGAAIACPGDRDLFTCGSRRPREKGPVIRSVERFLVLGPCPRQGLVPTHAILTPSEFAKLKGPLHYCCAGCRSAHCSGVESLQHASHEAHTQAPSA